MSASVDKSLFMLIESKIWHCYTTCTWEPQPHVQRPISRVWILVLERKKPHRVHILFISSCILTNHRLLLRYYTLLNGEHEKCTQVKTINISTVYLQKAIWNFRYHSYLWCRICLRVYLHSCNFSIVGLCRLLKFVFRAQDKHHSVLRSQSHCCWWPEDATRISHCHTAFLKTFNTFDN